VQDLARELDDLMTSIASRTGIGDASRVAILAAFHLADQLRTSRGELEGVREHLNERSRRMAAMLDGLG
jgi:cell division protein ZapA (FtsZ GTPase activity inhibitor)